MRNITLSADEGLIKEARDKAEGENSTLNAKFREWLKNYIARDSRGKNFEALLKNFENAELSDTLMTREERNAR